MIASEFLERQVADINNADITAIVAAFEFPFVVVQARNARFISTEDELIGQIETLRGELDRIGCIRIERDPVHIHAPGKTLTMISFRDSLFDAGSECLGTVSVTYAMARRDDSWRICIVMIDDVSGDLTDWAPALQTLGMARFPAAMQKAIGL